MKWVNRIELQTNPAGGSRRTRRPDITPQSSPTRQLRAELPPPRGYPGRVEHEKAGTAGHRAWFQVPSCTDREVRFWVDEPSCSVLAFVVRRLAAESAVMLIAVREGLASVFDDAGPPELRLAGLTEDAARGLLDFRGQGVLSSLSP